MACEKGFFFTTIDESKRTLQLLPAYVKHSKEIEICDIRRFRWYFFSLYFYAYRIDSDEEIRKKEETKWL